MLRLATLLVGGLAMLCTTILSDCAAQAPRPEYPRPGFQRAAWMNLNGEWDYTETDDDGAEYLLAAEYPEKIVVPFCRESELSGLGRLGFVKNVWYRKTFQLPDEWYGKRIILNVGGADWKTRVWVNDFYVGEHEGGTVSFGMEITDGIEQGENVLVIHVYDDTRSGLQPLGKQSVQEESHGCVYTRTTGIWGTVWLEPVSGAYIKQVAQYPEPDESRIRFAVDIEGYFKEGTELVLTALADGKEVGRCSAPAEGRIDDLVLRLSEKRLWSIENPFLYDLDIKLVKDDQVLDEVTSYFGLRKIIIEGAAILINDQPVFQRLVLDQGFYPDGIWTAPSDEALKQDILLSQEAGFNGARLHQKVFEPRFLYWADKLGYILWGEYANWGMDYANPQVQERVLNEWAEVVARDRNHPSIIGWCPFNETPASAGPLQRKVFAYTRKIDPTRPVIETSGWTHTLEEPMILDGHDYNQNPESFGKYYSKENLCALPQRYGGRSIGSIPFFISEYGGTSWNVGDKGWGYGKQPEDVDEFHERVAGLTKVLLDNRFMFGFCYTQLYDIEQEQNGIYTYDRQPKFDIDRIREGFQAPSAFEKAPPLETEEADSREWKMLFGAAVDGDDALIWKYTIDEPSPEWNQAVFDDEAWPSSRGGFGQKKGHKIAVPWETSDIWLRGSFDYDGSPFDAAMFAIHYDNGTTIFLNGTEIWSMKGWVDRYDAFDVTEAAKKHLKKGTNTIAVHTHQDGGGQYIDMALLVLPPK